MMTKMKRLLALALAVVMVMSLAACGDKNGGNGDGTTPSVAPTGSGSNGGDTAKKYTFNDVMEASPTTWNPHTWENNGDSFYQGLLTMGFVDTTIAADGVNYEWKYEMATAITDITKDYADKEKWGITEDENRIFQIDLNPDAKWEDGTPINADSYIYSMQQLLSSEMKNYRANSYYSGECVIMNSKGYFNNDLAGSTMYDALVLGWEDDGTQILNDARIDDNYFLNVEAATAFLGEDTIADYLAAGYDAVYPSFGLFADYIGAGYVPVTDEIIEDLTALSVELGDPNPTAWWEFVACQVEVTETPWEDVGLLKTGEYQLVYITEAPITMFNFLVYAGDTWLVDETLYEAGKKTVEGLVATDYCTTAATTKAYGPYKLVSYEKDKQIVMTKNENWYGYTDGKHEGEYQTTDYVIQIISDHNTQLLLFNQGKLDSVSLTSDDMATYRMSDYLLKTDETYTFRWVFASDLDDLKALEAAAGDGANKQVLYYDDFRKAISLSMDRTLFCNQATSAYKPAYFLLNSVYYYNIENDSESIYRNTPEAMEAVLRLYGIEYGEGKTYATVEEAYKAVTGYDVEAAKELFQSVYEQAIADGLYTDGQDIKINCMVSAASSLDADDTRQQDLMNDFVAAATVGTGFEGKITFTFQAGAENRYLDVAEGRVEMIRGAWGGAAFYPFRCAALYTDPVYMGGMEAIHESNGWDPTVETLDITYDFDGDGTEETLTKTLQAWSQSINGGEYINDANTCLKILSELETAILESYQCIPWSTMTSCSLYSKKIEYATYNYNIMYGYGGLRLMTYNYDDAAWEAYVADQGGTLSYE